MDHLDRFASQFPFSDRVGWVLVVATKADLWWSERDTVLDLYRGAAFQSVVKRICRHSAPVRAFSSTIEPFLGSVPADGKFGEMQRREVRSDFVTALVEQMAAS